MYRSTKLGDLLTTEQQQQQQLMLMVPFYDVAFECTYPAGNDNYSLLVNEYCTMYGVAKKTAAVSSASLVSKTIIQAIKQQHPPGR